MLLAALALAFTQQCGLCVMNCRLYCLHHLFSVRHLKRSRRRGGLKKTLSFPGRAKQQCAIWGNATHVESSAIWSTATEKGQSASSWNHLILRLSCQSGQIRKQTFICIRQMESNQRVTSLKIGLKLLAF